LAVIGVIEVVLGGVCQGRGYTFIPRWPATAQGHAPEEIERALTARVESLPLDQLVQDYFDRKRGWV
jgi:hypothetical protein